MSIKYLTIHCAATPEGRNIKAVTLNAWARERFGQLSYHHIVELDGTAVRNMPDTQRGAHVAKNNTGNVGICYVGGCDKNMKAKDTRTPAQKDTLARLIKEYKAKYPGIIVRGHRDWPGVKKDCPSFDVATFIKENNL